MKPVFSRVGGIVPELGSHEPLDSSATRGRKRLRFRGMNFSKNVSLPSCLLAVCRFSSSKYRKASCKAEEQIEGQGWGEQQALK